jgi:hypothetical protein
LPAGAGGRGSHRPLAGPKNERSGPEKGRRAARPVSGLWGRESGPAGLLTRAFSRQRSASLRSLRAAADAPIVGQAINALMGNAETQVLWLCHQAINRSYLCHPSGTLFWVV